MLIIFLLIIFFITVKAGVIYDTFFIFFLAIVNDVNKKIFFE